MVVSLTRVALFLLPAMNPRLLIIYLITYWHILVEAAYPLGLDVLVSLWLD